MRDKNGDIIDIKHKKSLGIIMNSYMPKKLKNKKNLKVIDADRHRQFTEI